MKYAIESSQGYFGPFDDRDAASHWANHYLRSYPWRMLQLRPPPNEKFSEDSE